MAPYGAAPAADIAEDASPPVSTTVHILTASIVQPVDGALSCEAVADAGGAGAPLPDAHPAIAVQIEIESTMPILVIAQSSNTEPSRGVRRGGGLLAGDPCFDCLVALEDQFTAADIRELIDLDSEFR